MASNDEVVELSFPELPATHAEFPQYIINNADKPLLDLLEPYKKYDTELRKAFAQQPDHPAVNTPNILPVFDGFANKLKIRARNLSTEPEKVTESYIMPLQDKDRRSNDSPAIVDSLAKFKEQFSLFSESALSDMDWSNVVAAGSSVVTPLLPVPEKYSVSKRAMRQYYHEVFAPASDIDLFLYDLTEEQAIDKIRQIEQKVKDALLVETTTIRTKNAITIASQYPTRHIQIVLRIYKSVSEILTGFDVDCSCAAFDGKQVWANPRALVSYMTQTNVVDLTRRSPSYENRLSKYRHRGFEVYWPDLDRSRIDPTIYERSFLRTEGLARLLVLEKLPTSDARDEYLDQRRLERGRPVANRYRRSAHKLIGDIKTQHEDEVAEWADDEDVSSYHTFTIPYGPAYHAAKIEKLLYTKDLLLNAEWNKPKDREVHLHRHPAFFGSVDDVIHDCCGYCPQPSNMEEEEVYENESKIYVSGKMTFLQDDPGRQAIGSFNPLSADDYTEMAYVGNTEMFCRAIVDGDVQFIESWLDQEGNDPNTRDYTGRTPLHLAVMQSTPEIVQILINHGARLIARLVDGRTALHIACMRGNIEMVKALLTKSAANEEEENEKIDARREAHRAKTAEPAFKEDSSEEDSDIEMLDDDETDIDATTESSMVNIKSLALDPTDKALNDENKDEPDVYDVNIVAWDTAVSPLHLAILKGHIDIVKCLVQEFGADVLLPAKLFDEHSPGTPKAAILTLVLALNLPQKQAEEMTLALFELGATCSQADLYNQTAFQACVIDAPEMLDLYQHADENGVKRALHHCSTVNSTWDPRVRSAFMSAIELRDGLTALKLLALGSKPTISYAAYTKATQALSAADRWFRAETHKQRYEDNFVQPVILAVTHEVPEVALAMVREHDVDVNTLSEQGRQVLRHEYQRNYHKGTTLLDLVRAKLKELKEWTSDAADDKAPVPLKSDSHYLDAFKVGTYQRFTAEQKLANAKKHYDARWKEHTEKQKKLQRRKGLEEKQAAIFDAIDKYRELEAALKKRGAKEFAELHPDIKAPAERDYHYGYYDSNYKPFEKVEFSFKLPAASEDLRNRYAELFDAAWRGDAEAVKSYVLVPWTDSEGTSQSPLKISTQDESGLTPFSIAVLHGYLELASTILELTKAQFSSKADDEEQQRTRIRGQADDDDDDYSDSEDEDNDSDDVQLTTEKVHDKFTIDNVGEVTVEVKSSISPTALQRWTISQCDAFDPKNLKPKDTPDERNISDVRIESSYRPPQNLIQWAVWQKNSQVLTFLLETGAKYHAIDFEDSIEDPQPYSIPHPDFLYAVEADDVQALGTIIKATGAGIPLHQFAKKSGVELAEKPKYYQGLSVRGAKKKDWAMRGRNQHTAESWDNMRPPIHEAAFRGVLETVEWFHTDAPWRCYKHYAETHPEDKRIQQLEHNKGGFERMVKQFLGTRTELALHCAVMSSKGKSYTGQTPSSIELTKQLINDMPESLNLKSEEGITPLHIAFALCHEDDAKLLIQAGADQTARTKDGRNIIHMLLSNRPHCDKSTTHIQIMKRMLNLVDKRLLKSLFAERSAAANHTQTPLAQWVSALCSSDHEVDVCRLLLETSEGVELNLVDGRGHTPLHAALQRDNYAVCKLLIEHSPQLIHRENATGRTPYEQVEDQILADYFRNVSAQTHYGSYAGRMDKHLRQRRSYQNLTARDSEDFLKKTDEDESWLHRTWRLMQDTKAQLEQKGESKRTLVTLNEANEVARRLSATSAKQQDKSQDTSDEKQPAWLAGDEVKEWLNNATATHQRAPFDKED